MQYLPAWYTSKINIVCKHHSWQDSFFVPCTFFARTLLASNKLQTILIVRIQLCDWEWSQLLTKPERGVQENVCESCGIISLVMVVIIVWAPLSLSLLILLSLLLWNRLLALLKHSWVHSSIVAVWVENLSQVNYWFQELLSVFIEAGFFFHNFACQII